MAITAHRETEFKYEAGAELPSFRGLPGVSGVDGPTVERLAAVYFDTADLRLARHGVTLRRRTGGQDAGWHLKVPAGDSRTELRLPLDDGPATNTPPDELVDLTTGLARGAEIRPVVLLKTERQVWKLVGRKGKQLAEVADDQVTASRLDQDSTVDKWRELELELSDPDAAPTLDRALRKAGLHRARHSSKLARALAVEQERPIGDTAGEVLLAYVRTQFDELVTQDLRVRRDAPDAVHQMRVAARRLRSALRVYRRLLPSEAVRLSDDLRWLGRRLSEARDLEVQHEHLRGVLATLPDELVVGPVSARLTRHFGPAAATARERVLKTLGDKRYLRLLDAVDRLLADPRPAARATRPAARELPKHVRRAYRKTKRRRASDTLHRTRKAAKRYRYALEVAEPAVGGRARKARKAARAMTKLLGEHQDGTVVRPLLRSLGMKAHLAGENGFTYGLLHDRERTRCTEAERVFPEYWKQLRKTRLT